MDVGQLVNYITNISSNKNIVHVEIDAGGKDKEYISDKLKFFRRDASITINNAQTINHEDLKSIANNFNNITFNFNY